MIFTTCCKSYETMMMMMKSLRTALMKKLKQFVMRQGQGNYWGGAQNVGVHRKSPLCRNPGGREQSPLKLSHFETDNVSKLPEIFIYYYSSSSLLPRPVVRIDFWEGVGPKKSGPFKPHPPYPSYKNPIFGPFCG